MWKTFGTAQVKYEKNKKNIYEKIKIFETGLSPMSDCDVSSVNQQMLGSDMKTNMEIIASLPNHVISQVLKTIVRI